MISRAKNLQSFLKMQNKFLSLIKIQQYTLTGAPSDYIVSICDVDGSDYLTAADASHVLQKVLEDPYVFPIIEKIYDVNAREE